MPPAVPRRILPVIVLSQVAGTSPWIAVNAVLPDLQRAWSLPASALASLTSAVQLGFVAGTLVFALLMLADRFRPTRVFLACSVLAALCNAAIAFLEGQFMLLLALRFAVGFLLAGIYPVGMKIAASWYREGLGAALGVLVGALVMGTALPHGLRALAGAEALPAVAGVAPWQAVVLAVSVLAAAGGLATAWLIPSRAVASGAPIRPRALAAIWSERQLRASVFGYFGHMWELYAFYTLLPLIIATRYHGTTVSALAFWAIAAGALGCAGGGLLASWLGSARIAQWQLAASGLCCLASPWLLAAPDLVFVLWLLVWGLTVVGDSPQFSALTARNAPPDVVGSVLTFTNCIGFAISVLSIELFARLAPSLPLAGLLPWLAAGPILGLWFLRPLVRRHHSVLPERAQG